MKQENPLHTERHHNEAQDSSSSAQHGTFFHFFVCLSHPSQLKRAPITLRIKGVEKRRTSKPERYSTTLLHNGLLLHIHLVARPLSNHVSPSEEIVELSTRSPLRNKSLAHFQTSIHHRPLLPFPRKNADPLKKLLWRLLTLQSTPSLHQAEAHHTARKIAQMLKNLPLSKAPALPPNRHNQRSE